MPSPHTATRFRFQIARDLSRLWLYLFREAQHFPASVYKHSDTNLLQLDITKHFHKYLLHTQIFNTSYQFFFLSGGFSCKGVVERHENLWNIFFPHLEPFIFHIQHWSCLWSPYKNFRHEKVNSRMCSRSDSRWCSKETGNRHLYFGNYNYCMISHSPRKKSWRHSDWKLHCEYIFY